MKFRPFVDRRFGHLKRQAVEERAAVEAVDSAIVEHVTERWDWTGPIEEPLPDHLAVGGENEWAWSEFRWFGEVLVDRQAA